jgi:hypothetical protein
MVKLMTGARFCKQNDNSQLIAWGLEAKINLRAIYGPKQCTPVPSLHVQIFFNINEPGCGLHLSMVNVSYTPSLVAYDFSAEAGAF